MVKARTQTITKKGATMKCLVIAIALLCFFTQLSAAEEVQESLPKTDKLLSIIAEYKLLEDELRGEILKEQERRMKKVTEEIEVERRKISRELTKEFEKGRGELLTEFRMRLETSIQEADIYEGMFALGKRFRLLEEDIKLAVAMQLACNTSRLPINIKPYQAILFMKAQRSIYEREKTSKPFPEFLLERYQRTFPASNYYEKWLPYLNIWLEFVGAEKVSEKSLKKNYEKNN